jgi:hypothetical protein
MHDSRTLRLEAGLRKLLMTVTLLFPAALHAQTLPGGAAIDDSRIRPAHWEVTMTLRLGDREVMGGTMTYEIAELPGGLWAYITQTNTQLGTATDTSIAKRGTLEPVRHRSHAAPRTLSLDYAGRTVTGVHAPRDSAPRLIERTTEVPTFDAAMLDMILASLPLATGYTTRLPVYIEELGGLAWFAVAVAGEITVGSRPAWDVRVTHPRYEIRYSIGRDDRQFLGGRVEYPNGAVMVITRN